jgi:hypothetical protein
MDLEAVNVGISEDGNKKFRLPGVSMHINMFWKRWGWDVVMLLQNLDCSIFTCVIPCILGYICYKSPNICTTLSPLYYLFTFAYMFRPFMDHHQGVIRYQVCRLKCASIYNTRV